MFPTLATTQDLLHVTTSAPSPPPPGDLVGVQRSGEPPLLVLLSYLCPCLLGYVLLVAAAMVSWNKVSPASPYPDNVQSDVDEGLAR